MKKKKVVWMSAFINVVPADYENWLEELESQGWHLDRIGQWSSIYMTFERATPRKYRYVYDMQAFPTKEYKAIYEDFGWEHVGQMAGVVIWRKEYSQERPESFTDSESLVKRTKRVAGAASVSFVMFSLIALALAVCFAIFYKQLSAEDIFQFILGFVLTSTFASYMGHVVRKIYKNR